jgi:predicted  nucleic acid-binding Zn-ribbon protein
MNKTLLLILVDFLLLNLLALTRWEEPPERDPATAASTPAQTVQSVVEEDLVGALRSTLEEERLAREALNEQLSSTQQELSTREETIAEREARLAALAADLERKQREAAQLNERVADSQAAISQLSDRLAAAAQDAATSRSQSEQLARELAERQRAAAELAEQVQSLERTRQEAQERIQSLNTQVQVAETERTFLRESVDTLRTQVGAEREEKLKLQEQTGRLAEGVTQLAESSATLRQEIRSNTPINANALFDEFRRNRVSVSMLADRDVLLGSGARKVDTQTILVTDGTNVVALFHVNDTVASLRENAPDWRSIQGTIAGTAGEPVGIGSMFFLRLDPRLMVVPVDAARAETLGVRLYPTALEPFKFSEAVLISGGGDKFGEVEFKIDPQTPGYVRMQSRVLSRLFGEFAPSAGDLVFSKTGELLGVMVNNTYCRLVDSFLPGAELPFGDQIADRRTGTIFESQRRRVLQMPFRLQ